MTASALEAWAWAGLCRPAAGLPGLSVARTEPGLGWLLTLGGGGLAALGVLLIYLRSRLPPLNFATGRLRQRLPHSN